MLTDMSSQSPPTAGPSERTPKMQLTDLLCDSTLTPSKRLEEIRLWNERRAKENSTINLYDISIHPADYTGIDLSNVEAENCNFDGAILAQANFTGTKLINVSLKATNLHRARLDQFNTERCDFSRVDLRSPTAAQTCWARVSAWLNWSTVRSIGNLQILTKISYAMLVFVPLLAAVWPQVRHWYSERAMETSKLADELRERAARDRSNAEALKQIKQADADLDANPTTPERVRAAIQTLRKSLSTSAEIAERCKGILQGIDALLQSRADVAELKAAYSQLKNALNPNADSKTLTERAVALEKRADDAQKKAERLQDSVTDLWLPWAWVLAFAAAVAVSLAHLIYQTTAPTLVREQTELSYAEERWKTATVNNVVQQDEVLRALRALKEVAEELPNDRHPNLVFRHGRTVFFPNEPSKYATEDGKPDTLLRPLIEEGAVAEYGRASREYRSGIRCAIVLYFIGGIVILLNLALQCRNVAAARGY